MLGVEALQSNLARTFHTDVAHRDLGERGGLVRSHDRGGGVGWVHVEWVPRFADAYVFVDDVANEAASADVRLDAQAVVGAVDREIGDADRTRAAVGLAADRHAV